MTVSTKIGSFISLQKKLNIKKFGTVLDNVVRLFLEYQRSI
jgi:hypothetical protein